MSEAVTLLPAMEDESLVRTTVRLPQLLLKDVKRRAVETDVSLQDLIIESLRSTLSASEAARSAARPVFLNERQQKRAESQKQKVLTGLAMVKGTMTGIDTAIDLALVSAACRDDERAEIVAMMRTHAAKLREFANQLEAAQ